MNNLINITEWNEHEVRIEISGNGHYVPKEQITTFLTNNILDISLEIQRNMKES